MRRDNKISKGDGIGLRDRVIFLCIRDAFSVLKETTPTEDIMKAMRLYMIHSGMAMSLNGSRRFNITGKDLREFVIPYYWINTALSDRTVSPLMFYEHGAVVEARDCKLRDVAPEFCLATSHQVTEGISRDLNPDFHYIFTHHLSYGDDYCRYVVLRKGSDNKIDDLGELKGKIDALDMTDEEVASLRGELIGELFMIVTKVLVDLDGTERTLKLVSPKAERTGRDLGKDIDDILDPNQGPKERAREALALIRSSMNQEDEAELSKDGTMKGTTCSCPFKDGTVVLCRQYESMLNSVCKAIDPKLEFVYTHMMTQGEPSCAWTIRRAPAMRRDIEAGTSEEDFLQALKMRLAKGEISEDEYLKIKAILLER